MCAFGSSTPRAPRGRQFGVAPAGASCATCGRMLIPHSRMRYGSESAARRAGVQRSRARRPPGARGRRVFAASRRDFFPFRFRRPARLGGSHTNLGPAGARPLSRFRIVILRVWHAGLPMAMLHASMLPGFVVHAPWHSLASPRGRMCSELGRGLAVPTHLSHHAPVQGRAQGHCEGRCQPTISTDTTTDGHIDAEHGDSQQRSGSATLRSR